MMTAIVVMDKMMMVTTKKNYQGSSLTLFLPCDIIYHVHGDSVYHMPDRRCRRSCSDSVYQCMLSVQRLVLGRTASAAQMLLQEKG